MQDRPYKMVTSGPGPGEIVGVTREEDREFDKKDAADGLSVATRVRITDAFLLEDKSAADLALELGLPRSVVRRVISQLGLLAMKEEATAVARAEDASAYADFLATNRVPTAKKHLEVSNTLVDVVQKLAAKAGDPDDPEFADRCEDLKKVVGLFRSLSETLDKAANVGSKSTGISANGDQAPVQQGGTDGKRPLITFNINAKVDPQEKQASCVTIEG